MTSQQMITEIQSRAMTHALGYFGREQFNPQSVIWHKQAIDMCTLEINRATNEAKKWSWNDAWCDYAYNHFNGAQYVLANAAL